MRTIAQQKLDPRHRAGDASHAQDLLVGEIEGVAVRHHVLPAGARARIALDGRSLHTFFLIQGQAQFDAGKRVNRLSGKAAYLPEPSASAVDVVADEGVEMLEIVVAMSEADHHHWLSAAAAFPYVLAYDDCEQYRDYFKSEKTVSRTIVPPHLVPRFCMGSVESTGPDRIEPHAHPMLDQYFFSFAENDITLLIDGERHPMGGNTLLHIPLGSEHGVEVEEGRRVHYLWLDFFPNSQDMDYLVEVHKPVARAV